MREFQGHRLRGLRRFATSRVAQAFLLLLLILIGESLVGLYQRARAVGSEEKALKQELATLQDRRTALIAEVAALETERGIEALIRERFGLVREGEKVINLVGAVATVTPPAAVTLSWWQKIANWFK